jgi:signal transduction histidine kinase
VQEIESRVEQIMADSDKVGALASAAEYAETRKLLLRIVATGEDLAKLVQVTIDGEREALTEKDAEVAEAIEDSVSSALFGGGLAVAVGFIAAIFISRRVAAPLRDLRNAAGAIGEGKFDVALPTNAGSEVGELARSFHEMAGRLKGTMEKMARQERLSVLGQMAGTVSHELRNPLATIGTSLHTLRQTSESKGFGIERMLDRIERSIERCNGIVADLLDYARVRELSREATALDRFLGEVLDEHTLPDSVVLERDLGAGVDAMLDRERFRRVMINLLDNAAQAMTGQGWTAPDGRAPTLTVRAEVAGPHIRVSVADNGPGIKAELLARIFEPLFTTKSRGVGLGLPLVRQIVEQHGGTIDVESRVGAGTTFTIFLPRQPAKQQADSAVGRRHAA